MTNTDATLRAALDYFTGPLTLASSPEARELATQRVLALGDAAYPVVLEAARRDGRQMPGVLELLARFGRADSVPLLARVLGDGSQEAAWTAAQALGIHPAAEARQALLDALRSERVDTVVAALGGLRRRADASARPAIEELAAGAPGPITHAAQLALRDLDEPE